MASPRFFLGRDKSTTALLYRPAYVRAELLVAWVTGPAVVGVRKSVLVAALVGVEAAAAAAGGTAREAGSASWDDEAAASFPCMHPFCVIPWSRTA